MEQLKEIFLNLNPFMILFVGIFVSASRMLINGFLHKRFNVFEVDKYKEGLPFQFIKMAVISIVGVLTVIGMFTMQESDVFIISGMYASMVFVMISTDVIKIIQLYNYLEKKDKLIDESEIDV